MTQRTPTKINLALLRSGRTEWDLCSRLAGRSDHPVSESGREELLAALDAAELPRIGIVLHGPDEASRATADLVASRVKGKPREVAGLVEVDLGLWCGLLTGDLEERYRTAFGQWRENPTVVSVPEGEPIADAEARLGRALYTALERIKPGSQAVAIVLRPLAFQLVRRLILDRPLAEVWEPFGGPPVVELHEVELGRLKPKPKPAPAGA